MENFIFYLDEYIESNRVKKEKKTTLSTLNDKERFITLCNNVSNFFKEEWEQSNGKNNESSDKLLELQRKAIIGYEKEVNFFKDKIRDYLKKNNYLDYWFPKWYDDLISAIFNELWGLAGISQWKNMKDSSSAKIIGERIYFLINGEQRLQEQTITKDRLNQLKRALLLSTPEIRLGSEKYAEVYMLDGTRITIFDEGLAKEPVIIFRKYTVQFFTFEEQARRGTIPYEIIPMFKSMVDLGFNICFVGPVRSAKTTFLETWQSYENPHLEGIMVETDPEIPLHQLMPIAPIMQIVADGNKLKNITKNLMRGDADYLILAEARDAVSLKIALEVTSKGTRRVKSTYHTSYVEDFAYDAANLIVSEFGGDLFTTVAKVAKCYDFIFELTSLRDKSKKRLKGIHELRFNDETGEISTHQICKYDFVKDNWTYKFDISEKIEEISVQENVDSYNIFKDELKKLVELKPMLGNNIKKSVYRR